MAGMITDYEWKKDERDWYVSLMTVGWQRLVRTINDRKMKGIGTYVPRTMNERRMTVIGLFNERRMAAIGLFNERRMAAIGLFNERRMVVIGLLNERRMTVIGTFMNEGMDGRDRSHFFRRMAITGFINE
jgi:hypothetical protein